MGTVDYNNDILAAADIGGTTVKLGLFSMDGELLGKWEIKTDLSENGRNILPDLSRALLKEADGRHIYGAGIGVPGAVDEHASARNCTNIGWGTTDLNAAMRPLLTKTELFCFGNDASVAALGELKYGAGRNYSSAYLITLGTGVGGGYAADGKVTRGAAGAAGEIGHILINPGESTACMCGRRGCLEQYASASGIVRLAENILALKREKAQQAYAAKDCIRENGHEETVRKRLHIERLFELKIPEGESGLKEGEVLDSKLICGIADKGDSLAEYIVELCGSCLGLAMSSISCTIDPEVYIIGGGMSRAGRVLLDAVKKGYRKYAYPPSMDTDIIISGLGNDAGIYGCLAMLTEQIRLQGIK